MYSPKNLKPFFDLALDKETLYQGDIIRAEGIGLKEVGNELSPDYWLIITKTCDLSFDNGSVKTRKETVSVIPLISLLVLKKLYERDTLTAVNNIRNRIVLIPLMAISKAFSKLKAENVDKLVKDELSKFMYIPPDGTILTEPMVLDFDITRQLDGADASEIKNILTSKALQLASPFREKVAQRFAEHYASIGIEDDEVRDKGYTARIREYLNKSKEKSSK